MILPRLSILFPKERLETAKPKQIFNWNKKIVILSFFEERGIAKAKRFQDPGA